MRVDTVRFYERQGLLPAPVRTRSGYRQFPEAAVERIRFIKQAQAVGFSLVELTKILPALENGKIDYERGQARLSAVAARVDAKIAELRAIRRQLTVMMERFSAGHCEEMERVSRAIRKG